jgi:predicted Ser/Thr protein kinase
MELSTPSAIGKYTVVRRLGAGAMGVVYLCAQPELDRPVAVKVLSAGAADRPDQLARFQREARSSARLNHPNVVRVYDVGSEAGCPFLVMEYVDGRSLEELLSAGPLPLDTSLRLTCQVAQALQAAHEEGIIHRDVKPSNILIDSAGRPRLADFGLAKCLADGEGLSSTGAIIGTPRYLSPEQALAAPDDIDHRTDIYSLGSVLYEMLTGQPRAEGANILAILRRLTDEDPISVRALNPAVPPEVESICLRCLAREPAERFATAKELAEAIQGYLLNQFLSRPEPELLALLPAPAPPKRPKRRWWFAAGVVLFALTAGVLAHSARPVVPKVDTTAPQVVVGIPAELREKILAQARDQLRLLPRLDRVKSRRETLKSSLDDLTALLKHASDDPEVRLLRARTYRRGGECLFAVADLEAASRVHPDDLDLAEERLLARYQLLSLYLGNVAEQPLRPPCRKILQADLDRLLQSNRLRAYRARLIDAITRGDASAAVLAEKPPAAPGSPDEAADLAMLQADALFRAAEQAKAEENAASDDGPKDKARRRREELAGRASQALRRGLENDPGHVGLLFLKANSLQRRANWEADEHDSADQLLRRHRPAFETSLDRLRDATLRQGGDTALARAVLLSNYGRPDPALDQLQDALNGAPTLGPLHTFKAWLRLHHPSDGTLTPDDLQSIVRDLDPLFETAPEEFAPYLVRALVDAAAGRWEDARADLRQGRRRLGPDGLPSGDAHRGWLDVVDAPDVRFLDATVDVVWQLPTPVDLRIKLAEELVQRLNSPPPMGLTAAEHRHMQGFNHLRLAKFRAEKDDRDGVVRHLRLALGLRLDDLTPDVCRNDDSLKAWNDHPDFVRLYAEFAKKS